MYQNQRGDNTHIRQQENGGGQFNVNWNNLQTNYQKCDEEPMNNTVDGKQDIQNVQTGTSTRLLPVGDSHINSPFSIQFSQLYANVEQIQESNHNFSQLLSLDYQQYLTSNLFDLNQSDQVQVIEQTSAPLDVISRDRTSRIYGNDPGSSKNFPKNIGSRLQKFIKGSFTDIDMVLKDQIVQDFLNKDSESINKGDLNRLKASPYGAQILRLFFGDYIWATDCVAGKKMELTQALIINQMWCDEL